MPDDRFNEYCEALLAQYTRRNTKTVTQRLRKPVRVPQTERQCGTDHVRRFGPEGHLRDWPQRCRRPSDSEPVFACEPDLPRKAIEYVRDTIQDRLRQEYRKCGQPSGDGQLLGRDRDPDTARHTD